MQIATKWITLGSIDNTFTASQANSDNQKHKAKREGGFLGVVSTDLYP